MLNSEKRDIMLKDTWFSGLEAEVQSIIFQHVLSRRFEDGELVYHRGDEAKHWLGIVSGALKVGTVAMSGKQSLVVFLGPGEWIGDLSLAEADWRATDISAHGDTELLMLPQKYFNQLLNQYPSFVRALLSITYRRMRMLLSQVRMWGVASLEERLEATIAYLADRFGQVQVDGVYVTLHVPQEVLAQVLGVSRQRINQLLKTYAENGSISLHYGQLWLSRGFAETLQGQLADLVQG